MAKCWRCGNNISKYPCPWCRAPSPHVIKGPPLKVSKIKKPGQGPGTN